MYSAPENEKKKARYCPERAHLYLPDVHTTGVQLLTRIGIPKCPLWECLDFLLSRETGETSPGKLLPTELLLNAQ